MPTCCKTASVESVNLKNVIQGNVGNKLKSIARSLANRHVPTIEEIMEVGLHTVIKLAPLLAE